MTATDPLVIRTCTVASGVRPPDADHPAPWAAVRVDSPDGTIEVVDWETAADFGVECIRAAGANPDKMFSPALLSMPDVGGMTADSATLFGAQIMMSAVRASCLLAVSEHLHELGWTETDVIRFLDRIEGNIKSHGNP